MNSKNKLFDLTGRVVIITGGGGLLGYQHAAAVGSAGAIPILLDINLKNLLGTQQLLMKNENIHSEIYECDITNLQSIESAFLEIKSKHTKIDVLINNAAQNPKIESSERNSFSRLEKFPIEQWDLEISVGLTGAFNCCKVFGYDMAKSNSGGAIINISSDLGVIAPDQRIYSQPNLASEFQPVKPVTYSVIKHGIIGLTKYLSTYWINQGVRCNVLSPGGVYDGQNEEFVEKLSSLIPMGRMAKKDEYRGAIIFLASDASSYLNGANLIMDGGRTAW